jgi:hypothetical protein
VPSSCLVEVFGFHKTEFLSQFLKENAGLKTAWIEKEISINPYALWQRGVDISSILFIECGKEAIWTVQQILNSQVYQATVLSELAFKEMDLRKFQLLVEKTESHLFLLSRRPHQSWIPALQIEVEKGLRSRIKKQRGFK